MDGSRTAFEPLAAMGEKIVDPVFESKNDYDTMYMFARKFGFADRMFKEHQGREWQGVGGGYSARDQSRRLVDRLLRTIS